MMTGSNASGAQRMGTNSLQLVVLCGQLGNKGVSDLHKEGILSAIYLFHEVQWGKQTVWVLRILLN